MRHGIALRARAPACRAVRFIQAHEGGSADEGSATGVNAPGRRVEVRQDPEVLADRPHQALAAGGNREAASRQPLDEPNRPPPPALNRFLPPTLLIWIDLSTTVIFCMCLCALGTGHDRLAATVDQSDMRGLGTDRTSLRRGAALL